MRRINALLVFLFSSLVITGISFIDDQIWNVVFLVVGMIAYAIVGVLFSIGVLHGKKAGKDAYAFVFFLLILGGLGIYQLLVGFKRWVISWPLAVKIIVPVTLVLIIGGVVFWAIWRKKKNNRQNVDESVEEQIEQQDD